MFAPTLDVDKDGVAKSTRPRPSVDGHFLPEVKFELRQDEPFRFAE